MDGDWVFLARWVWIEWVGEWVNIFGGCGWGGVWMKRF